MTEFRLAACVIVYYPDKEVLENIRTYIDSVNKIYLLDNTPTQDISPQIVASFNDVQKVEYISFGTNVGMGQALNYAARKAIEDGYSWLLTMDQDSAFLDDTYFNLLAKYVNKVREAALFSPMHLDLGTADGNLKELDITMTSGNVLNLAIWSQIGGFNDSLFIDEVDHEYCLRAKLANYKIMQVNIRLFHKLGKYYRVRLFGKNRFMFVHSPVRLYYIVRNNFYMFRQFYREFPRLIADRKKELLKSIFINIILDPTRAVPKLRNVLKGYKHARKGIFGKIS